MAMHVCTKILKKLLSFYPEILYLENNQEKIIRMYTDICKANNFFITSNDKRLKNLNDSKMETLCTSIQIE